MSQDIVFYDHPLTERVRLILRAHSLLYQSQQFLQRQDSWGSLYTLHSLVDLLLLLERHDVRLELQKEFERISSQLKKLESLDGVDREALQQMLATLNDQIHYLNEQKTKFGESLQQHYLLQNLKHKQQARLCNSFEIPMLHQWLHQDFEIRDQDLQEWFGILEPLLECVDYAMQLFRDCFHTEVVTLENGNYQRNLDGNRYYPLVRLGISAAENAFPEISASRHCINIRLLSSEHGNKPQALKETIEIYFMQCSL